MDRVSLKAEERDILGKKVKKLRKTGLIPAHVFGNKIETEHVSVELNEFLKVYQQTGESGLIDLKIGAEKIRPVLIREFQTDPVKNLPLHIDFYQVNLNKPVQVTVPVVIIGEEPETVHSGEAVVIQPLNELEVEALPANLPENIEVDITSLKQIDDVILVSQLNVPEGVTVLADAEAVVVKLDTAISAETQALLEEQAAEQQAAAEAVEGAAEGAETPEGEEAPAEGGEGEAATEGGTGEEGSEGGGNDQGDKS